MVLVLIGSLLYQWSLISEAPFIPTPQKAIEKIANYVEINDNDVVFDLGCGDGRFLEICYKKNSRASYIGIEKKLVPFLLAKLRVWRMKSPFNIKIVKGNIFKQDFSKATFIYTYLFPEVMEKLEPKLEKELKPGAVVISCDFKFKNKQPEKIINLGRNKKQLANNLVFYRF
jgi:16S rRNA A1518/A1519 N6-dimethyltransferase RsmA/KsgA/DIM1 with predicted DNA glycosylase/AP lyase activity